MTTPNISPTSPSNIPGDLSTLNQPNQNVSPTTLGDTIASSAAASQAPSFSFVPVLPIPHQTILEFSSLISSTEDAAKLQTWLSQQNNDLSYLQALQNNILSALGLVKLFAQVSSIARQMAAIYQEENNNSATLNQAITNFNNSQGFVNDQAQVAAMNQAVANYNQAVQDLNDGKITQAQFDAAASTYNRAVSNYEIYNAFRAQTPDVVNLNTAIQTYNQNVTTINQQITALNATLGNTGVPPLTPQTSYVARGLPPATSAPAIPVTIPSLPPPQPLPNAVNSIQPPVPDAAAIVNAIFVPIFKSFSLIYGVTFNFIKLFTNFNSYIQFFLQGPVPTVPPAYVTPLPEIFLGSSGGTSATGSGISLGILIGTLTNPLLSAILDQSSFLSQSSAITNPLDPSILNQVQLFNLQFLRQVGLFAALESLGKLGFFAASSKTDISALSLVLAVSFGNQIATATQSDKIKEAIQGILQESFPELAGNSLATLAKDLSSVTQLLFLENAISQIGQAIGNPKLFGQLLATLPGASNLVSLSSSNTTLKDILNNSISIAFLKDTLVKSLSNVAFSNPEVAVNDAINAALIIQQGNSENDFKQAILNELIKKGFNANDSQNAANLSASFLSSEIHGNLLLDTALNSADLNQQKLVNSLTKENIDEQIAKNAISSALLKKDNLTKRQLRDSISAQLIKENINPGISLISSTRAVIETPVTFTQNPLSLPDLKNAIASQVINSFSSQIGVNQAKDLSDQVIHRLIGSDNLKSSEHSLRNQLDAHLSSIKASANNTVSQALDDNIRSFLKPNLSLYSFNNEILDPGKMLIHSLANGPMYNRPLPSNYQHPTDVLV